MASKDWGDSRHGTPSGFKRHQNLKEEPCVFCKKAKIEYDHRRRLATDMQIRNRRNAKAQNMANRKLVQAHYDEYKKYYDAAKKELESDEERYEDHS